MSFWLVAAAMTIMVGAVLARAVLKGSTRDISVRAASDVDVYRAQLAEVDRDVARGVIDPADAERVHAEVARRLLAADTAAQAETRQAGKRRAGIVVFALIGVALAGSLATYMRLGAPGYGDMALSDRIAFAEEVRRTRPAQEVAQRSLPDAVLPDGLGDQYRELLIKLRETVEARPDDLEGYTLLVRQERNIGDFKRALAAQRNVVRLRGDDVSVADLETLGDLLVLAAGGYVSPEAETVLRAVLARDPSSGIARYYLGLMLTQTGRPDQAFRIWDQLLRQGPETAAWIEPILFQIEELAQLAGVRYAIPEIGGGVARGPSQDDLDAAAEMTPAERMEMIGAMVSGLSDRLAREGGPAEDWARLISSLGVMGEWQRASAIHTNAIEVFADDKDALEMINAAGRRAGVID
ncbi:c-type cytochrome biogenesis protein CcmI [Sulfitobacter sp. S190]|nr:c-type cytochrome biogenesis protein CcmI [Sulfitobacter sp. S190]